MLLQEHKIAMSLIYKERVIVFQICEMKKKYQRQTVIAGYAFAIELLIHGFPDFKLREYSISPKYHVIAAKIIYIISF